MCSPDENWRPIQIPSNHLSEITPSLRWTGNPVHDWGSEGVDLARVGLPGEVLPGCLVAFADLEAIQKVARMFNQLWEETDVDREFFAASLFQVNEQSSHNLLDGLHGLLGLPVSLGITTRSMRKDRPC